MVRMQAISLSSADVASHRRAAALPDIANRTDHERSSGKLFSRLLASLSGADVASLTVSAPQDRHAPEVECGNRRKLVASSAEALRCALSAIGILGLGACVRNEPSIPLLNIVRTLATSTDLLNFNEIERALGVPISPYIADSGTSIYRISRERNAIGGSIQAIITLGRASDNNASVIIDDLPHCITVGNFTRTFGADYIRMEGLRISWEESVVAIGYVTSRQPVRTISVNFRGLTCAQTVRFTQSDVLPRAFVNAPVGRVADR